MRLLAEKQALESSHGHLQDLFQRLEAERSGLQQEKAQAQEQHSQVRDPQDAPPPSHHLGERR